MVWSRESCVVVKCSSTLSCANTTLSFRHDLGLSIIGSHKVVREVLKIFATSRGADCVFEADLGVESLSGKGKGLITAGFVNKGQTILLESPQITASAKLFSHVTHKQGLSLCKKMDSIGSAPHHGSGFDPAAV